MDCTVCVAKLTMLISCDVTLSLEMFVRTKFSQIFTNLLPRELNVFADKE